LRILERARKLIDDFRYNEGIFLLLREQKRLKKLAEDDEIKIIDEIINDVKNRVEIPLVTLEPLSDIENLEKYETTYKALDKAQISLENNRLMKAVSELKEARANLKTLKIGKKYIKDIDAKIRELQERLGKKPAKENFEAKEKEQMHPLRMFLVEEAEKAWKTIDSIMIKESIDEITLERQYLPEVFDKGAYTFSVKDRLPTLNSIIARYLRLKGIITELYGKLLIFKRIEKLD